MPSRGSKRNDTRPDKRGSSSDRARRRQFLLDKFGDGTLTACALKLSPKCLGDLDFTNVSSDRWPITGSRGGTYRRNNIRPACKPCQDTQGGQTMSPTYWTSTQIIAAARENGWEFIKVVDGHGPWGMKRGRHKVMIQETRRGGLSTATFTYPVYSGSNVDHLGPRYRDKLAEVLAFLKDPDCRHPRHSRHT